MIMENLLPNTKEFREIFRYASKQNNLQILESNTKYFNGSFYNLCYNLDAPHINFRYRKYVRDVNFFVFGTREDIKKSVNYVDVAFTLQGKHSIKTVVRKHFFSEDQWSVTYTCVIAS